MYLEIQLCNLQKFLNVNDPPTHSSWGSYVRLAYNDTVQVPYILSLAGFSNNHPASLEKKKFEYNKTSVKFCTTNDLFHCRHSKIYGIQIPQISWQPRDFSQRFFPKCRLLTYSFQKHKSLLKLKFSLQNKACSTSELKL